MSYIIKPAKDTAWRTRVVKNLAAELILSKSQAIKTTPPLARSLVKIASKLVTLAKQDTLHSRRLALRYLVRKKHLGVLEILFTVLKEKYRERVGGYTRIKRLFHRRGDNALMVEVSLV